MKKAIALSLIVALLFSVCACAKKTDSTRSQSSSQELVLPFSSTDSTDPYACKSETNVLLSELLYDSLFSLKSDKSIVNEIAQSYTQQDKTITVKLKAIKFSDGSELTSDDVVHSFSRAKQCERYKTSLRDFENAERKGKSVVRFTLNSQNRYALNLLCFPIVCQKNNLIGSGLYKLSEKDGEMFLEYNKNHEDNKPKIERFNLCECKDYTNAVNLFNAGKIDFLFDTLSDGNIRSNALNTQKGKLNHLLFLGLNAKKGVLKNKHFRRAVSFAINQTELCSEALSGFALPCATPFDPEWHEIGAVVSNSVLGKSNEAKEEFLNAGCCYDKMGINLLKDDKQVTLTLVVNSANNMKIALAEQIRTQLVNFGISVEVKKMPLDEYNIAVENVSFDMYIGEVKIQNDFELSCFFADDGGAHFGIRGEDILNTYRLFKSGEKTLQEFVSLFSELNPFVPIGYKYADVCFNPSLKVEGEITQNRVYDGIEEWSR